MNPLRLALRTLLLGRPRARLAIALIALGLCALDLLAGRLAAQQGRLEYEAVVGERLGHLVLVPRDAAGFDQAQADAARRAVEAVKGVALVAPQTMLSGVAASGGRSALFLGAGVPPAAQLAAPLAGQPGRLRPGQLNGIAVSDGQARSLGIGYGSAVTLVARAAPREAQVVDVYRSEGLGGEARTVLVPLDLAQELLATRRIGRLAVFLADPEALERLRPVVAAALRQAHVEADVRTWHELSASYAAGSHGARIEFASAAAVVLALVCAAVGVTVSIGALERRRQLATLRALGMRRRSVFALLAGEVVWMVLLAAAASVAVSGLVAWIANRAAPPFAAQPALAPPPVLVELDPGRMLAALVAVLAAALLAASVPALRAARVDVAQGLSPGERPGW